MEKLHSIAHDITSANHDRDFQDLNLFLADAGGTIRQHQVRVFDMEERNGHLHIQIHQFGDDNQMPLDRSINVLVWNGQMRFFPPTADTWPTSWIDWAQFSDGVTNHRWTLWPDVLAVDDEAPQIMNIHPC